MEKRSALADLIDEEMAARNLTYRTAREAIGLSSNTLVAIRHSRRATSPRVWAIVARWLGVTVESLRRRCLEIDRGVAEEDAHPLVVSGLPRRRS